jgi:hypothetical protein
MKRKGNSSWFGVMMLVSGHGRWELSEQSKVANEQSAPEQNKAGVPGRVSP